MSSDGKTAQLPAAQKAGDTKIRFRLKNAELFSYLPADLDPPSRTSPASNETRTRRPRRLPGGASERRLVPASPDLQIAKNVWARGTLALPTA